MSDPVPAALSVDVPVKEDDPRLLDDSCVRELERLHDALGGSADMVMVCDDEGLSDVETVVVSDLDFTDDAVAAVSVHESVSEGSFERLLDRVRSSDCVSFELVTASDRDTSEWERVLVAEAETDSEPVGSGPDIVPVIVVSEVGVCVNVIDSSTENSFVGECVRERLPLSPFRCFVHDNSNVVVWSDLDTLNESSSLNESVIVSSLVNVGSVGVMLSDADGCS